MESVLISLDNNSKLVVNTLFELNKREETNDIKLESVHKQKFSDGELCVNFLNSVRGKRVYLLTSPNDSDEIIKLMLAIDAAKRAAAKEIIPIIPYFPYQRSDKKDYNRGPIGAKVMVDMIEGQGATGIVTFDLHADQIQGFFTIPITHLEGKNVFDEYIKDIYSDNLILAGPDAGSGKRVKRIKEHIKNKYGLQLSYVMLDKTRSEANVIDSMEIIGDVTGKDVIILDDMVDTAGTLCKAAEIIIDKGAKSVRAIISHGVLSGPALDRIEQSKLTELIISDSLPRNFMSKKIKTISLAKQIALAISAINTDISYEWLKEF